MIGNIILCGLPGAGKTEVGKQLSQKLSWQFVETDAYLENLFQERSGKQLNCRDIHRSLGETAFRALESQAVGALEGLVTCVIATGGGTWISSDNRAALKKLGRCIYLQNERELIFKRLVQRGLPPYLDPQAPYQSFETLANKREKVYESADIHLHTGRMSPEEIADKILLLHHMHNANKD